MKLWIVSLILVTGILACAGKDGSSSASQVDGEAIYTKYCRLCHGQDGKLGVNGSKDISISTLSEAERVQLIKHGKNTMTPFEGVLTEEQMKAVAHYSMTLKQ